MLDTLTQELSPRSAILDPASSANVAESEIAVIRTRFRRLGYDMWVHPSSSDWNAWYYQEEPLTETARFAVGNTAAKAFSSSMGAVRDLLTGTATS